MSNIALTKGERYTLARQGTVTIITDSTDSAEAEKRINNNLTLSGSADRKILINASNTSYDAFVHLKSGTTQFTAGIRGIGDTFTISRGTNALSTPGSSFTALRIPDQTYPTVHFDHGINVSGSSNVIGSIFLEGSTRSIWFQNSSDSGDRLRLHNSGPNSYIDYATGDLAFRSGITTRVTFKSTGTVGIGTTSPSYTLHVNGSVAGTSGYINLSDKRFKKDIKPIENALDTVLLLEGVTYNWNLDTTVIKDKNLDSLNHIGFVAQDIEKILPQVVSTANDEDKSKSVAYSDIVPVLTEAIKELSAQIKDLKTRIQTLEHK